MVADTQWGEVDRPHPVRSKSPLVLLF